jgi:hypothetical protein
MYTTKIMLNLQFSDPVSCEILAPNLDNVRNNCLVPYYHARSVTGENSALNVIERLNLSHDIAKNFPISH